MTFKRKIRGLTTYFSVNWNLEIRQYTSVRLHKYLRLNINLNIINLVIEIYFIQGVANMR